MQVEPRISFRDMDPSPAIEAKVQERIERLEKRYGRLTTCQVVIESPHRHQQQIGRAHV